jgi:hypothetical protein
MHRNNALPARISYRIRTLSSGERSLPIQFWEQPGKKAGYLFLDPLQAPFRIHNGIDIVLKCDLLSGMLEGQSR